MSEQPQSSKGNTRRIIIALVIILIIAIAITGINYYLRLFGPNVTSDEDYLYIHTGSNYTDVYNTIKEKHIVKDTTTFNWAAYSMKYVNHVKPGKYRLHAGMSNHALVRMLQLGQQELVNLSFHNLRLKTQFAAFIGKELEPDSASMIHMLDSTSFIQQYGFTPDNVYVVFLPNTYQVKWNTTPVRFFKYMHEQYEKFWTPERKQKAAALHLSPVQVSILASIVDAEALHDDEMPKIAGLYLNRLNQGMKLQADPTLIFAKGDFTIHRVLNADKNTPSPYNTYLHNGLPPGPIMMPSVHAIDAVLNYTKSDYIYMCAKEDFSGYHNFAATEAEHKANARRYQQALNERNIKR